MLGSLVQWLFVIVWTGSRHCSGNLYKTLWEPSLKSGRSRKSSALSFGSDARMLNQISGLKLSIQRGLCRLEKPLAGRSSLRQDLCAKEARAHAVFFNITQLYCMTFTQSKTYIAGWWHSLSEGWEYIPGWREWNGSTPNPASLSPLPYIQLQSIEVFFFPHLL